MSPSENYSTIDRFLRRRDVEAMVALSYSRIYELIRMSAFPPPVRIGCASRWSQLEVQDWLASRRSDSSRLAPPAIAGKRALVQHDE